MTLPTKELFTRFFSVVLTLLFLGSFSMCAAESYGWGSGCSDKSPLTHEAEEAASSCHCLCHVSSLPGLECAPAGALHVGESVSRFCPIDDIFPTARWLEIDVPPA